MRHLPTIFYNISNSFNLFLCFFEGFLTYLMNGMKNYCGVYNVHFCDDKKKRQENPSENRCYGKHIKPES